MPALQRTSAWLRRLSPALVIAISVAQAEERTNPDKYVQHVKTLASPDMQGRGAGTKGLEKASRYIAGQFKQLKLQPAGEKGDWFQNLQVTTGAKLGQKNRLGSLRLSTDFTPLSFSSSGRVTAPIVFAGYGITASEFQHDDYAHLDVKDKIVLLIRYEPKSFQKGGAAERMYTHHASLVSKAINARNHGAKAVILANGESSDPKQPDTLIRFGTVAGPDDVGVLMAQVTNAIADKWIADLKGSKPVEVDLQVDITRERADVRNVVGYLPGRTKEYVILGAHYDHLGFGNESSLAPSQIGTVHAGADDNASGTAGLLELARLFAGRRGELARGVMFIAFAGEEIGLLGSSHWVTHPTLPLENAVAMINMDMIGRVSGSKLYIGGVGTGSTFEALLKNLVKSSDFTVDFSEGGFSASDHTSFAAKSIPVLFFFSGLHGDYHKPSDTWEKINGPASAKVVNLVSDVALNLVNDAARPQFVRVQTAAGPHGTLPPGTGGGGGYGPYFGSIPDFAPVEKGVRFADVRDGSPAGKAGLKAGDILIGFAGRPIVNLYDFTYALRNSKVGETVSVTFLRDGKEMTAQVTLEARR